MPAAPPLPRFVITGPSGWIGRAMLAHLEEQFEGGLANRVTLFASSAKTINTPSGETLSVRPLAEIGPSDIDGAHVIHLAYLTKEKAELLGERVFTDTNLAIDDYLLNAIRDSQPKSVFVASSGAAHLAAAGLDLHPYGMCKLRQEARFIEAGEKCGAAVLAGRIFNIAGPYINKTASYAISDMAIQAREKNCISIKASTPVFRSFLHVSDLCALIRKAGLVREKRAVPVDLCGGEVVEMVDLADAVSKAVDNNVRIERTPITSSKASAYLGDFTQTRVLAMALDVTLKPLKKQIEDTVTWLFSQPKMPSPAA